MPLLLSLVRHAKSSWDNPELPDFERPLSARGCRDAPVMAQRLRARPPAPDLLLSSPAVRALATARQFAHVLQLPETAIVTDSRIYEAQPEDLVEVLRDIHDNNPRHVLLIGHNPGVSRLAGLLSGESPPDMPTCAVLRLEFAADAWAHIAPGAGCLVNYDYPKRPLD